MNYEVMSKDETVGKYIDGRFVCVNDRLCPLFLKKTGDFNMWLSKRAVDSDRPNARLLKNVFGLSGASDADVALKFNAATITDTYWVCPENSALKYKDIRFTENMFDDLALKGTFSSFDKNPSRTPELTNIGSYEKCWELENGNWWMYKSGKEEEILSEMIVYNLCKELNFPVARYETDGKYIKTQDFTNGASVNLEHMSSLTGDDENYSVCFNTLYKIDRNLAKQFLAILYMDTICKNVDRHTDNFGLLRNPDTGDIISMAPNYDNNLSLVARKEQDSVDLTVISNGDFFINEFVSLMRDKRAKELFDELNIHPISVSRISEIVNDIPITKYADTAKEMIVNRQAAVLAACHNLDIEASKDKEEISL